MVSEKIIRKIEDLILGLAPIPYFDREIIEIGEGIIGVDMPGMPQMHISELSTGKKILLLIFAAVPLLDLEYLDLIGLDPFKGAEGSDDDRPTLDPPSWDKTASKSTDPGSGVGSGRREINQKIEHSVRQKRHSFEKIFWTFVYVGIPIILIIVGALVFTGYDQLVDEEADRFAGIGTQFEGVANTYVQARNRVFCLLKGPSCLRQHRMNQTTRPGSDEVGQTYGLKIDRFQIGQGEQMDIAHRNADYQIPVSFTISNPRHGLKGITAKEVSYRIRMIDNDRDEQNPYCNTGWIDVDNAYDADPDDNDYEQDDIFPGTSASTGFLTIVSRNSANFDPNEHKGAPGDGLTLRDCELLQPALGSHRTVLLDVKYDYFSQASLYFEAMSQQNFQSNPNLQKEWQESETADTPVKAAINVNTPVLFDEIGRAHV